VSAQTIQNPDQELARTEARLPRWMMACAVMGTVAAAVTGHFAFAAGFALGAGLAVLSFYWLHESIQKVFSSGQARLPKRVVVKLLLRYPLAFGAVYVFYRTGWLPFGAILAGFFVPLGGIVIEEVIRLSSGWRVT
jgi:ATP synthase I chain